MGAFRDRDRKYDFGFLIIFLHFSFFQVVIAATIPVVVVVWKKTKKRRLQKEERQAARAAEKKKRMDQREKGKLRKQLDQLFSKKRPVRTKVVSSDPAANGKDVVDVEPSIEASKNSDGDGDNQLKKTPPMIAPV